APRRCNGASAHGVEVGWHQSGQRRPGAARNARRWWLRPCAGARSNCDSTRLRQWLRYERRARGSMTGKLIVGVDVGGTFTDLFFLDEASGRSWIGKVPSTRGREAEGFLNGVRQGTSDLSAISTIVHGTTVGTNALLERKGGKPGVIATEGFRDV